MRYYSAIATVLLVCGGCESSASDICDEMCECNDCSDKQYDRCIIDREANIDVAAAHDCEKRQLDYDDCEIRRATCTSQGWFLKEGSCDREANDLKQCIADSSSRN